MYTYNQPAYAPIVSEDVDTTYNQVASTSDQSLATSSSQTATSTEPKVDQLATSTVPAVSEALPKIATTPPPTTTPAPAVPSNQNILPSMPKTPSPSLPVEPVLVDKLRWGVFTGSNIAALDEFERTVDANPDYLATFVHWGNHDGALPAYVKQYAYEKDRTLVLFWEASDYVVGGTDQPEYAYRNILAGNWDTYITDFKNQLREYEGPVILIPFSELNGDWTPWSGTENGNTPEESILAYRYLHDRMNDLPNVSFGWAVNSTSFPNTPANAIERYYPGDAYVDYVGVDGFNMGTPWQTFGEIFDTPLTTLAQYNKPTLVFSFGSAPGPRKASWLKTALTVDLPKHPHVVAWVYFNQDKERNWLLWSDSETFEVFTDYIKDVD